MSCHDQQNSIERVNWTFSFYELKSTRECFDSTNHMSSLVVPGNKEDDSITVDNMANEVECFNHLFVWFIEINNEMIKTTTKDVRSHMRMKSWGFVSHVNSINEHLFQRHNLWDGKRVFLLEDGLNDVRVNLPIGSWKYDWKKRLAQAFHESVSSNHNETLMNTIHSIPKWDSFFVEI